MDFEEILREWQSKEIQSKIPKELQKWQCNESIENILDNQFEEIIQQGCILRSRGKLTTQVTIDEKGKVRTKFDLKLVEQNQRREKSTLGLTNKDKLSRRKNRAIPKSTVSCPGDEEECTSERSILGKRSLFQPGAFNIERFASHFMSAAQSSECHTSNIVEKSMELSEENIYHGDLVNYSFS